MVCVLDHKFGCIEIMIKLQKFPLSKSTLEYVSLWHDVEGNHLLKSDESKAPTHGLI